MLALAVFFGLDRQLRSVPPRMSAESPIPRTSSVLPPDFASLSNFHWRLVR
jgi:hypothetical protein